MKFFVGHFIDPAYDNHGELYISRVRAHACVHSPLPRPRLVITDAIVLKYYNTLKQMINLHRQSLCAPSDGPRSPRVDIPTVARAPYATGTCRTFSLLLRNRIRPRTRRDRETVLRRPARYGRHDETRHLRRARKTQKQTYAENAAKRFVSGKRDGVSSPFSWTCRVSLGRQK